jgi:hypothetical protein
LISRTPDKEVPAIVAEKVTEDEDDLMTGCLLNDPTLQVFTIITYQITTNVI